MTHHIIPVCSLLLAIALPVSLHSTEPLAEPKFPAMIRIVEAKPQSITNFHVRLIIDQDVDIYANQPKNVAWDHVAARLVIHDADGKPLDSRFSYPDGIRVDSNGLGALYVYRNTVDMTVSIADDQVKHPLAITLECAGYNRLRSFCLGKMKLNTVRK